MPERSIRISSAEGKWVLRAGGAVLGETSCALELSEGDLKPVIYFPRRDVAMAFLEPSGQETTCPHKGRARYYSIHTKSTVLENAAWSYEEPTSEIAPLRDHLAFDLLQVTVERL